MRDTTVGEEGVGDYLRGLPSRGIVGRTEVRPVERRVAQLAGTSTGIAEHDKEGMDLRYEFGDAWCTAATINNLGVLARMHGDYARAISFSKETLAMSEEVGNKSGMAMSLSNLGLACKRSRATPYTLEQATALFTHCNCLR